MALGGAGDGAADFVQRQIEQPPCSLIPRRKPGHKVAPRWLPGAHAATEIGSGRRLLDRFQRLSPSPIQVLLWLQGGAAAAVSLR
jgi:hypothetical protein